MNASFYFCSPCCCSAVFDRCFWRVGKGCGSLAKAQATARVDVTTTLSLSMCRSWWLERGPYSCLAMMKMKVKHLRTCHVLHACAEVEKNTSITAKAWRHLSWTFEEAPRLAARATRELLDGTLFDETEVEQEEPPEKEDLILHDYDDDDDAEDPESTGTAVAEASTAVAEASEPFPTVAAEVARAERFLYLRCRPKWSFHPFCAA